MRIKSTKSNSFILDDILNFEYVNNETQIIEAIITTQLKLEIYYYIFSNYPNNHRRNCTLFNSLKLEAPVKCYKQDVDILETNYYKELLQNIDLRIFQEKN